MIDLLERGNVELEHLASALETEGPSPSPGTVSRLVNSLGAYLRAVEGTVLPALEAAGVEVSAGTVQGYATLASSLAELLVQCQRSEDCTPTIRRVVVQLRAQHVLARTEVIGALRDRLSDSQRRLIEGDVTLHFAGANKGSLENDGGHAAEEQLTFPWQVRRCVVLVADDHSPGLQLATEAMHAFACEVVAVASGDAAVRAVEERRFDLIFLDIHMPGLDGFQSAERIRQVEEELARPRTPIVALTASAMPHEQQACFDRGMDDVLTKPFRLEALGEMLRKWCPA